MRWLQRLHATGSIHDMCGLTVSLFVSSCERHVESVCSCVVPMMCNNHRCEFSCLGADAVCASGVSGFHQVTLGKDGTLLEQKPCAFGTVTTCEIRGTPDRSRLHNDEQGTLCISPCKTQILYAILPYTLDWVYPDGHPVVDPIISGCAPEVWSCSAPNSTSTPARIFLHQVVSLCLLSLDSCLTVAVAHSQHYG